ncbi:MAG: tRNA (N6-threonylcarbamoyladenosine(37)-N6)-methyltransferase TrmO [Acidobacteriota bacterium]|nr:tRNA (N6-threonylcarbamoyladenosine(37)-N6)-methyltransferase TrmO [Acidobacteriota bacterium]
MDQTGKIKGRPGRLSFRTIGRVRSPFRSPDDITPEILASPTAFDDIEGEIHIHKRYAAGLKDIDGFSHLIVIFAFHKAGPPKLLSLPPGQTERRGVFATRSPHRPGGIGMTVVRLLGRKDNVLRIAGLDMIDGTPVLDIKPYTSRDRKIDIRQGWRDEETALTPASKSKPAGYTNKKETRRIAR